ncbi:MAG TPA: hypothetical protein VFK94_00225 [Patescibacteria group bacterium]|nr:hypothetical protein [Patescibacteria group bacterium]
MREPGDAAFAITEALSDGRIVVAFYVQTEEEMNLSVLERIYGGDNAKHNVQIALEAKNDATRHLRRKRMEDALEEAHDKARFMWNTNKSSIKMDGKRIEL